MPLFQAVLQCILFLPSRKQYLLFLPLPLSFLTDGEVHYIFAEAVLDLICISRI
jgi:hypothetical protein